MTPEDRKSMIRQSFDEIWNKGNVGLLDQIYAENCSFHDPSMPVEGVEGMKQQVRELRMANPDLHMDTHDVLLDGDLSAVRWTMGGTSRGEFRGLPATGKTYVMSGMIMDKWQGDRVVEEWLVYDLAGTLQQLGIIPPMEQVQKVMTGRRPAM